MRRPVVRLVKALYGHPNAGAYWESECSQRVRNLGYQPIGSNWPSVFWHPVRRMLLVVYLDDFKLAAPADGHAEAWKEIQTVIATTVWGQVSHFLGCNQISDRVVLHDGAVALTMIYDMGEFL